MFKNINRQAGLTDGDYNARWSQKDDDGLIGRVEHKSIKGFSVRRQLNPRFKEKTFEKKLSLDSSMIDFYEFKTGQSLTIKFFKKNFQLNFQDYLLRLLG